MDGSVGAFSTDMFPDEDAVEVVRETLGRTVVRFQITPPKDAVFRVQSRFVELPGVSLANSITSEHIASMGGSDMWGDDLLLNIPIGARGLRMQQGKADMDIAPGGAVLIASAKVAEGGFTDDVELLTMRIDRNAIAAMSRTQGGPSALALAPGAPGLALLSSYVQGVFGEAGVAGPAMRRAMSTHIQDLVALTLGASRDAAEAARYRGLMAARLQVLKAFVAAHLFDPDLNDVAVGRHLGVSSRYVRKLMALEDTGFSEYVSVQRLERARQMLTGSALAGAKIIDIAYRCGFGSVSTFNRLFLRRYGVTPSEARDGASVQLGGGRRP